jgi:hypothetical protein
MTHITRDRTDSELIIIKKNFSTLVNILQKLEIDFMVDNGLLLGIARDGDIIKWDWDIEFSLYDYDLMNNFENLIEEVKKNGFKIYKIHKKNEKLDIYKGLSYEIFSFSFKSWKHNKEKKIFERKGFSIPEKYFLTKEKVNYLGFKLFCPSPIEEYLTYIYGDWRTPKRLGNMDEYCTKDYYKKQSFLIITLKKIFYKIKDIYKKLKLNN